MIARLQQTLRHSTSSFVVTALVCLGILVFAPVIALADESGEGTAAHTDTIA